MKFFAPGASIGIIGGGQLALMLSLAAKRLGYKIILLEPEQNCPAAWAVDQHIIAPYDDKAALEILCTKADLVTYEFENIAYESIAFLEEHISVRPHARALFLSQDRLKEKRFLQESGFSTAPWFEITKASDLGQALEACGGEAILKTRFMGYDGKGQIRISANKPESIVAAQALCAQTEVLLEAFVPFVCEVSIIAARHESGEIMCYAATENIHKGGILHQSMVPASIGEEISTKLYEVAQQLLKRLEYIGILAIEFFILADGSVKINEIAPRVHNSGHWTEAACLISQFEQHIRAITGLPLGSNFRHSDCVMENLLGEDMARLEEFYQNPHYFIHLYGKQEARPQRKMGHVIYLKPKE